ncbi:C-type lectin domain family 10 member A-like isoform X2 [Pempheris klunzingeri]|uniref:C-type lectin domain family 10 member A-like isoform X2 n=1 Tax=Pempheris klunzingeri TaxID=3127111 RepID=UPI0039801BF3
MKTARSDERSHISECSLAPVVVDRSWTVRLTVFMLKDDRQTDVTMMTDYHYEKEQDSSALWSKEPRPVSLSGVSRFRRWLLPALTATVILILIIVLGATNIQTSGRLQSVENSLSNLSDIIRSLNASLQLAKVSEALKQLAVVDSLSRSIASLKCSLDHIINNSSAADGCCPLGWELFESSCYFFSRESLSWNQSRLWCNHNDAHLVILQSDRVWDFVTRRSAPSLFWVGLSDWRGRWEWVSGTPYTVERRRWVPGQPDNWGGHGLGPGDEDCAHLHQDGRLNDLHCSTGLHFICQRHSQRA